MKINLLADYRGVLTDELFYSAGVHDLPDAIASSLVDAGRAEPLIKPKSTRRVSRKRTAKKK